MKPDATKFDWYSLLLAAVQLAVGLIILIWPESADRILAFVLAALVLLAGIARTLLHFKRRERVSPFAFGGLSLGLTLLTIGIFFLFEPGVFLSILPALLSCILVFTGFASLQNALTLRSLGAQRWYIALAFALTGLVCGFLALFNPFATARGLMLFLGIALLGEGIMDLVALYLFGQMGQGADSPTL